MTAKDRNHNLIKSMRDDSGNSACQQMQQNENGEFGEFKPQRGKSVVFAQKRDMCANWKNALIVGSVLICSLNGKDELCERIITDSVSHQRF